MKEYFKQFVDAVGILGVTSGDRSNLMTVAWMSPVSFDPPIVMVAISPKRFTHNLLLEANEFTISLLADDQQKLASKAGTISGHDQDKMTMDIFETADGIKVKAPIIVGARAVLECRMISHEPIGDHTAFFGEVVRVEVNEKKQPLVYFHRKYYTLGKYIADYP
ncbi:MAG: flavin reductase family protein [Acidobacteria bacterium]|nr:flavin reductase family protein [Acidobacteriota bacterium]